MSTDIAESLPKRKFAPAPMVKKGAKTAPPAAAKKVERVHLKKVQKKEFVKQFMILDIVQEGKILTLKQLSLSICQIVH